MTTDKFARQDPDKEFIVNEKPSNDLLPLPKANTPIQVKSSREVELEIVAELGRDSITTAIDALTLVDAEGSTRICQSLLQAKAMIIRVLERRST